MHRAFAAELRRRLGDSPGEQLDAVLSELERSYLAHGDVVERALAHLFDRIIVSDRTGNVRSFRGGEAPVTVADAFPIEAAHRVEATLRTLAPGRRAQIDYTADEQKGERHFEAQLVATEGDEVAIFVRDVSERFERSLADLHRTHQEARAEALLEIAYAASHDLRAPLQHIKGLAEWLHEDLADTLDEAPLRTLSLLLTSVTKLDEVLSALLEYARAGNTPVTIEPIDLRACILEVVSMLPTEGFTIEVADDLPTLHTARSPFERVILNLVANAVKHHDGDHGTIAITGRALGDLYEIQIADDGPGIPDDKQVEVFKLFKKLEGGRDRQGSGMGLALVKKIVEHAGGTIAIASNVPRGAIFRFTWPTRWGPAARASEQAPRSRRVLVVDDSSLARELTRRMLTRRGFEVVEAGSVEAAMGIVTEQAVDAVVTELPLPGDDGFALIERIRSDRQHASLPVFVLTAEPSPNYARHAERVGASGYLLKPIRANVLATTLREALARPR